MWENSLEEPKLSETIRSLEIVLSRCKWNRDNQEALRMQLENHRAVRAALARRTAQGGGDE